MTPLDFTWIVGLAVVMLAAAAESARRYGDWFAPLTVFVGVNAGSLALYHLRLLGLNPVSPATHALVLGSFLAFLAGTRLAAGRGSLAAMRERIVPVETSGLDPFFLLTGLLSTVGWVVALAILAATHGLGVIISNVWMLQNTFQMQFIGYLNLLGILVAPLYAIRRASGRTGPLDLLLLASSVLGLLLAGIKSYMFYAALSALLAWSACRPGSVRLRHVMGGMGLLIAFFVAYTAKVDVFVADAYEGAGGLGELTFLQRPYLYIVGSWPALESVLHGLADPPPRLGFVVLQPLWKILGEGLGLIEPIPPALPFVHIGVEGFNVYSFLGEVTYDLGWVAGLALSGLLGFFSTKAYATARLTGSWRHALVYGVVGFGVALSSFMYAYRFNVMVLLLYVYVIGFVVLRGGVLVDRRRRG